MDTKFFKSLFIVAAFALALSCNKDIIGDTPIEDDPAIEENPVNDLPEGQIRIEATLSDLSTKVDFLPAYDTDGKAESMALTWAEGDAIRVYDHSDRSKYNDFTVESSAVGQKRGTFVGETANIASATAFDVEVIGGSGFDFASQTQPSDGATAGLKYLASASNLSSCESVTFTELSSVLALTAQMPEGVAADIKSVDITASEAIFNGGKTLSITFSDKGDADNDGILHFFATLPQGNPAIAEGTTLLIHFNAPETSHDVYTRFVTLGAQAFTANKLNAVNVNASESDKHAGTTTCDGTAAAKAYLIGDKYQMQAMESLMKSGETMYFKMIDDIDLEGVDWAPLNNASPYDKAVNFDGGNHTISNLSCNAGDADFYGFFGVLTGDMCNVTFKDAVITCDTSVKGAVVGGDLGYGDALCNMSNVIINNAEVTSSKLAGILGAQGDNVGTISGCQVLNSSIKSSDARVGGLIGSVVKFNEISDCSVESCTVESDSYYAGGLIGNLGGTGEVTGCHATGSVKSNKTNYARTGGLIGYVVAGAKIANCYSTCAVNVLGAYCGGLVGDVLKGTLTKCYSTGSVTSTAHFGGGLVGVVTGEVSIEKSYFAGSITLDSSKAQAGGIISYMEASTKASISNCYSSGTISGRRWHGGIVGGTAAITSLSITNCYTTVTITGSPFGAIIGNNGFAGVSLNGNIAWWASGNIVGTGTAISSGCYIGQEGTISAKATELGWDANVWDLSGNVPTLK